MACDAGVMSRGHSSGASSDSSSIQTQLSPQHGLSCGFSCPILQTSVSYNNDLAINPFSALVNQSPLLLLASNNPD